MSDSLRTIGQRYAIEKLIGSRAVGRVYLGRDRQTGEPVAIKELISDWVNRAPDAIERFRREGKAPRNGTYTSIPIATIMQGIKRVDVEELYDAENYLPKVRHVEGKPMFLY